MDLTELTRRIVTFRDERDWKQFHAPAQLAAAIAIEAAELQEHFLWKDRAQVAELLRNPAKHQAVSEELADVMIYCLLLANELGADPAELIQRKVEKNAAKYPVEKSKGTSAKYTEL